MQKISFFFMLLVCSIAILATYEALFPLPATTIFVRFLGIIAFFLLCVALMMGPLAVLNLPVFGFLLEPRRAVGILAALFTLLHFALAFWLSLGLQLSELITQLAYALAVPALIVFTAMALTSSNWAVMKIGFKNWKILQRLGYMAFALAFLHFLLKATGLGIRAGNDTFVNLAEVSMIILGVLTIGLQLAGCLVQNSKKAAQQQPAAAGAAIEPKPAARPAAPAPG